MRIEVGAFSERGLRKANQDAWAADAEAAYAVVADGMGGPPGGDVASRLAVAAVEEGLRGAPAGDLPEDTLARLFREAHRRILREASARTELFGMGTTLVVLVIRGGRYRLAHAGDSRAYLVRGGTARPLTRDHSWVQERVDAGLLTPAEAARHPARSVLTRGVGTGPEQGPDLAGGHTLAGDLFLLTTDGVHGVLSDDRIGELAAGRPPGEAARALVEEALRAGGTDNATAVVVFPLVYNDGAVVPGFPEALDGAQRSAP